MCETHLKTCWISLVIPEIRSGLILYLSAWQSLTMPDYPGWPLTYQRSQEMWDHPSHRIRTVTAFPDGQGLYLWIYILTGPSTHSTLRITVRETSKLVLKIHIYFNHKLIELSTEVRDRKPPRWITPTAGFISSTYSQILSDTRNQKAPVICDCRFLTFCPIQNSQPFPDRAKSALHRAGETHTLCLNSWV